MCYVDAPVAPPLIVRVPCEHVVARQGVDDPREHRQRAWADAKTLANASGIESFKLRDHPQVQQITKWWRLQIVTYYGMV